MGRAGARPSTSAKILYRPVGLVSSITAGLIASAVFRAVWGRTVSGSDGEAPQPLESEYGLRQILPAALIQGAIYAVVKAATQRGGARAFQRVTGEWPGS
ncbi:hypothetical protein HMPREF0063_10123 [Aeromicrobium marinum DSM 15272]|uniref:DUF4235 domain-containing protein n=1 Tax=Aeromicrobium marinum DSM 15272 TaxID=585531 RepID=E2S7W6_9ACTN|nr:DUF4235 domain-containing protein [Aeromicrobium marinum]EFQ84782.1 hypothetical protein HMPREF0063_10123 [Aeromicrobium marinum DSM 15272]